MIPLIFLSQPLNLLLEFVKFLPGVVVVVVLDILVALRFVQLCLYLAQLRLRELQFCLNFVLFRVASVQPHLELFHLRKLRSLWFSYFNFCVKESFELIYICITQRAGYSLESH